VIETIALIFSSAVLGGGLMYGFIYSYGRVQYWKGMYETAAEDYTEAMEQVLRTEKVAQAVTDKYVTMTELVKAQLERPVVAALTDNHVQQIASVLSQLVINTQGPNRIN